MDLIQLGNSNLIAPRDEVVSSHHLHVSFSFELLKVVDNVLPAEGLPHGELVDNELLSNRTKNSLRDIKHLLFRNLDLVHLLGVLLVRLLVVVFVIVFLLISSIGLVFQPLVVALNLSGLLVIRIELLLVLRVVVIFFLDLLVLGDLLGLASRVGLGIRLV